MTKPEPAAQFRELLRLALSDEPEQADLLEQLVRDEDWHPIAKAAISMTAALLLTHHDHTVVSEWLTPDDKEEGTK